MRVANFFDRTAAAMSQVIAGVDPGALRTRIAKLRVVLAFDRAAAASSEGRVALELATDLLARFYPGLNPLALDRDPATVAFARRLGGIAVSIHRDIDLRERHRDACLCLTAGNTAPPPGMPTIYLGSHGWTARCSRAGPLGSADTGNPFGAAAAACIAVAEGFRTVFADCLPGAPSARPIVFDVLNQEARACADGPAIPTGIDLGGSHLVGLGAIGRATAWTLARVPGLCGRLIGVDPEAIERTNLQRYVASTQADQSKSRPKTRSVAGFFAGTEVTFEGHPETWGGYLAGHPAARLDLVLTALDTAADRIAVQASLPRVVLNAWTQAGDLGVSRHGFASGPCLACLYMPDGEVPGLSKQVAGALGLPEADIRAKLHAGFRVDDAFIAQVADATGVDARHLLPFKNRSLADFYVKAVCGTAHFGVAARGGGDAAAVPMAFQSALAGVLLAAELLAARADLRTVPMGPLTKIDLVGGIGPMMQHPAAKHASGRCLCQDNVFVSAYARKYPETYHSDGGSRAAEAAWRSHTLPGPTPGGLPV